MICSYVVIIVQFVRENIFVMFADIISCDSFWKWAVFDL